jgi:tetratricopeptide (TPR) repeat protein
MNFYCRNLLILIFLTASFAAAAQDTAPDLIKQGIQLNDQGKYADAIEKYGQALKIDPENLQGNYEMAFSLFASGKGNDGIPFIEKTIKSSNADALTAASYDLLGSIYDQDHKSDKAIEAYKNGIKAKPNYQRLHFNLGIAYFRNKQFAEAEASAIEAIKLDPKHASSQRLYALVTFHQNKRMNALLGFCSFILLEPNTSRSTEAYNNIEHILQGGVLKDANGNATIQVSTKGNQDNETMNLAISVTTLAAQKKNLTGIDLLQYQLKSLFTIAAELSQKKTDKDFFDKFFVDYFYKLAQSDNMPAFTHTVALTVNKEESAKWGKENTAQLKAMSDWLASTERNF